VETIRTIASLGTFFSVAVAIWLIRSEARRRSDQIVYERVGAEWTEFLRLAMEHPQLDPLNTKVVLGEDGSCEKNELITLHSFFVTLVGRVWRAYIDQPEEVRQNRWRGWEKFLDRWVERPDFGEFWANYGHEYDADFVAYVNDRFDLTTPEVAAPGDGDDRGKLSPEVSFPWPFGR
jgi:hypothetical protein